MSKSNVKRDRKSMRKVTIEGSGKNLTTYGGLIPVMKFLGRFGFRDSFHEVIHHTRANNAHYQLSDAVELNLLSLIAGARSLDESVRVWGDAGWLDLRGDGYLIKVG